MRRHNPAFIPRNHKVEEALLAATSGDDFSVMERLLDVLATPYDHDRDLPTFSTPGSARAALPHVLRHVNGHMPRAQTLTSGLEIRAFDNSTWRRVCRGETRWSPHAHRPAAASSASGYI